MAQQTPNYFDRFRPVDNKALFAFNATQKFTPQATRVMQAVIPASARWGIVVALLGTWVIGPNRLLWAFGLLDDED